MNGDADGDWKKMLVDPSRQTALYKAKLTAVRRTLQTWDDGEQRDSRILVADLLRLIGDHP